MAEQTAVSIGTFDGVHLGHQAILRALQREADRLGAATAAYAFSYPPRWQVAERFTGGLLLPEAIKRDLLAQHVGRAIQATFSDVRDLAPEAFAEDILIRNLNAVAVVVGTSFRFGSDRSGDPEALRAFGMRLGFEVTVVPQVLIDGAPVSSTRIRALVAEGKVGPAAALLGRPPVLIGRVEPGKRFGRSLGYPTANLAIHPSILLPANGVYVAVAFLGFPPRSQPHPALLYLGTRPTLYSDTALPYCEVHLLSPPREHLYGYRLEVHLLEHLRGDLAFPSIEDLRKAIAQDVACAENRLRGGTETFHPIGG